MVRNALIQLISQAIEELVEKQAIDSSIKSIPIEIEPPKQADHGDFATNFCLVASKTAKTNPRALAEILLPAILDSQLSLPKNENGQGGVDQNLLTPIASAEIAGPGFINFHLNPAWAAQFLTQALDNPNDFYKPHNDNPQKINVEFVSVNPNGPITIGSGRGAAFGSALCNVLEAAGNTVHREYYINDGVNSEQMRLFAESVKAIIEGRPVPDNGYKGDYVHEVAKTISRILSSKTLVRELAELTEVEFESAKNFVAGEAPIFDGFNLTWLINFDKATRMWISFEAAARATESSANSEEAIRKLDIPSIQKICEYIMVQAQELDLSTFQVNFDTWFSEQSLHDSGVVEQELHHLLTNNVADDQPTRTKVVFAKGGQIKEVIQEPQTNSDVYKEATDAEDFPPQDWGGQGGVEDKKSTNTIWLRSTKFGDDQDRVLKRADGRLTYIASDVAYHKDKFNRPANGDKLITVLGPDHHGYIARLTAVVAAMFSDQVTPLANPDPLNEHEAVLYTSVEERNQCQAALAWAKDHLEVQIFQLVRFLKDGKPAPMRKRDGNIYALIDLINEIGETLLPNGTTEEKQRAGSDVARFFYLMRHHDTAMDFDLELATKQSDENPVFYVQYAHARICSVIEKASEVLPSLPKIGEGQGGVDPSSDGTGETSISLPKIGEGQGEVDSNTLNSPNLTLLQHPKELALILKICDLPNEVGRTAADYSVNRLTTYAIELARTYHSFYDSCRVIQPDQPDLSQARLALCHATRIALRAALDLLGVSAPNRMERTSQTS